MNNHRNPERAMNVIDMAKQRHPGRSVDVIMAEAMRIVDERQEQIEWVEDWKVFGLLFLGCGLFALGLSLLLPGWIW
jgi:hypothetical protein